MLDKKHERIQLLEKQISRLQRRMDNLDQRSTRYSWVRLAIFFIGLAISVVAFMFIGWWLGLLLALITMTSFAIVAHFHGNIDRSLARHTLWSHIKATHIARMQLDWSKIPSGYRMELQPDHPFEFDLDITGPHSLHRLLNTAVSREGSQRLHDWLLNTTPDLPIIRRRQELVRELTPLTLFRDKLLLTSLLVSKRVAEQWEGQRLLTWLHQQAPSAWLLPLLWGTGTLNALTIIFFLLSLFVTMPQLWIFTLLAGLLLFFATANQRGDIFDDANYLSSGFAALSGVLRYLEAYPYGNHQRLKELCRPFFLDKVHRPSRLLKGTARIASMAVLRNNPLLWFMVNALIPWDLYCAYRLGQYKKQIATRLPAWLDIWFELEALSSLATFAYLNPEYVLPDVLSEAERPVTFQGLDLGHPLIPAEKKVVNDFSVQQMGEIFIITGSNMAGKSTFLRTLGVNLCLAYCGAPVSASTFQISLFRLFTCIRVSDSVTDGYSYFYAEVRRLKALLVALEESNCFPLFFLIDEIFKGTNNRERLIGSRSYVHALVGRNCVGAISTHDLELVKLAEELPEVKNYHFREEVLDGHMVFDYKLRPGPCPTTNALKIMQMEGLPVEE